MSVVPEHYFTIGEVLALLLEEFPDVTISKIRFLESQGLISPERTSSGYRKFTRAEIERLRFILREQKDNFLPLKVIKDRLAGDTSDQLIRPEDTTDPSMPRGIRLPSTGHPTHRAAPTRAAAREAPRAADRRSPRRMTRQELIESTAVAPEMLSLLEKMRFVQPQMLGKEPYYDENDRTIVHVAGRLAALGVEPRLLMPWRLAAEREADVFVPIARLSQSRDAGGAGDAGKVLDELVGLGEELRTALLRGVTKDLGRDS